jgi:hypothetical protein
VDALGHVLALRVLGWQAESVSAPLPPIDEGPPEGGGPEPTGRVAIGRALVLLVIAVVVGTLLLQVGSRPSVSGTAGVVTTTTAPGATTTTAPGATTTTVHHATSTTTTTTGVPHASVKVLVANGTSTPGVAAHFTQQLQAQGWSTLSPVDTTSPVSASTVYYAAGQQAAAAQIAASLGLRSGAVQPLTTAVPVSGTNGVEVVVVIGPDLAGQTTSGAK